jgi:transcriptional regulator with XRE-family HTH domain
MESSSVVGARIRDLRERAGVQSKELAGRLGIDPGAMSNIERGKRGVKAQELAIIAEVLNVSPLAILDEDSLLSRLPVAPRAAVGTDVPTTAFERLVALSELHEVLAQGGIPASPCLVGAPTVNISRWLPAAQTLAAWASNELKGVSPGDQRFAGLVAAIPEHLGIDVFVEPGSGELCGASVIDDEFSLIFVNSDQPTPRALFTMAHELGHILSKEGDTLTIDVDLVAHSDLERFANAFAACFLMPKAEIQEELGGQQPTAESLSRLLERFGVSFESLIFRLHNLGLIDADGRDRLRSLGLKGLVSNIADKQLAAHLLSRLGSRPDSQSPVLLLARTLAGYRQGLVSVRPLAGLLGLEPDQVLMAMELDADDALDQVLGGMSTSNLVEGGLFDGDPI